MTFPRFIVAGVVNTGFTYLVYLALLVILPYGWAYSLTYAVGVACGYLLNARWVFRTQVTLSSATRYPAAYLANWLLGLGLLWLSVERLGVTPYLAPLLVTAVTTPVLYIAARTIFRRGAS